MAEITGSGAARTGLEIRHGILAVAGLLVLLGLAGFSHAAVGYALFLIATLLLAAAVVLLGVFALTRLFETGALRRAYATGFWLGAWCYVLAVAAFSGHYVHEALAGRVDWKHMIFGPAILAAIVVLDVGIWRVIVERNLPTVRRFGDLWRREALDQPALRRSLLDEVILHRTLYRVSPFRWVRHQLIYWGFAAMFMTELAAVAFREAFPAFGWTDLWHDPGHPVRLAFDVAFELTGIMILAGCILALWFRVRAEGTDERKYADTPTVIFLLVVVLTGFLVEGARFAAAPGSPGAEVSLLGRLLAPVAPAGAAGWDWLWLVHALAACAFIAYVPLMRLIHSCATPVGRLANSQRNLMAAKKRRVIGGLFRGPAGPKP